MICSLSGELAKEPVVSPKSGKVFERRLIETYVNANGTDPINDEPLSVEDLIAIDEKPTLFVKPTSLTSIPTLLSTFQNEWDALSLEVFQLRKELNVAKEELSVALYYRDAAARVAAKFMKERDDARNALQELAGSIAKGQDLNGMEVDEESQQPSAGEISSSVPKSYSKLIIEAQGELFLAHKKDRKKFAAPEGTLEEHEIVKSIQDHKKAPKSRGNVTSAAFSENSQSILVGDASGNVLIFGATSGELEDVALDQESSAVTATSFALDSSAIVGLANGAIYAHGRTIANLDEPQKAVFGHPGINAHVISVGSETGSITYIDSDQKQPAYQIKNDFRCIGASLHLDGVLLALGDATSNTVQVYDLSTGAVGVTCEPVEDSVPSAVEFAPNGYWLAVGYSTGKTGLVLIYDLRTSAVVHRWALPSSPLSLAFDRSASILISNLGKSIVYNRYTKKEKKWSESLQSSVKVSGTAVDVFFTSKENNAVSVIYDTGKLQNCVFN
ncbi:unnamed protein product [Kuraishia capsulata CBS 1993]|uniref:Pre-mRNA-processing factor 19 n=1 Tax=Kuraishia capsulata CBS 1993 TaxID=1382522 RepID=W6MRR4_9ASCO|nr:uncharacterized protein KUCA_T00000463001 [Kuraishia capsulata CBS 1993]CDK24500.1 unnamed protein product [Kuraishia capsulata CBS 1993]